MYFFPKAFTTTALLACMLAGQPASAGGYHTELCRVFVEQGRTDSLFSSKDTNWYKFYCAKIAHKDTKPSTLAWVKKEAEKQISFQVNWIASRGVQTASPLHTRSDAQKECTREFKVMKDKNKDQAHYNRCSSPS